MKVCKSCKESKPLSEFYKAHYSWEKDGHDYYCKYCRVGKSLKSHRNLNKKPCSLRECNHPQYAKSFCRMHYARYHRTGSPADKYKDEYNHSSYIKYQYGITAEDYNRMAKDGCQICGNAASTTRLHVDHDHACCDRDKSCGKCVRGVLCSRCNASVDKYEKGRLRLDNPFTSRIQKYIAKYEKRRAKIDN
jgi:hypothetical protein